MFSHGSNQDSPEDGSDRTGNYVVKVKLIKNIPELVPILGKRVKFFYPGIQRLCTNCFGEHSKQTCQSRKVPWNQYVSKFIELRPEIPREIFSRWAKNNQIMFPESAPNSHAATPTIGSDDPDLENLGSETSTGTAAWVSAHANDSSQQDMEVIDDETNLTFAESSKESNPVEQVNPELVTRSQPNVVH
jgi:hypothetical protein